jgi:hypothetical protein
MTSLTPAEIQRVKEETMKRIEKMSTSVKGRQTASKRAEQSEKDRLRNIQSTKPQPVNPPQLKPFSSSTGNDAWD